jgi:hypothetical protein
MRRRASPRHPSTAWAWLLRTTWITAAFTIVASGTVRGCNGYRWKEENEAVRTVPVAWSEEDGNNVLKKNLKKARVVKKRDIIFKKKKKKCENRDGVASGGGKVVVRVPLERGG